MQQESIKSLWPWKCDDTRTWKYIDYVMVYNDLTKKHQFIWIENPNFAYKHLDPANQQLTRKKK